MIGNHLHIEYGYNAVKKQALGVKLKNMPSGTYWHCFIENVPYSIFTVLFMLFSNMFNPLQYLNNFHTI